jgi:hypothetical protein
MENNFNVNNNPLLRLEVIDKSGTELVIVPGTGGTHGIISPLGGNFCCQMLCKPVSDQASSPAKVTVIPLFIAGEGLIAPIRFYIAINRSALVREIHKQSIGDEIVRIKIPATALPFKIKIPAPVTQGYCRAAQYQITGATHEVMGIVVIGVVPIVVDAG